MASKIQAQSGFTGELSEFRDGQFLCTTSDFYQFVVSEEEAVKACLKAKADTQSRTAWAKAFELAMRRIADWCRSQPVAWCAVSFRDEDLIVVVCATNEDPKGELHDAMADLDLELFEPDSYHLSFMLFRASEARGISAFMDTARARIIYSAQREQSHRSGIKTP